MGWNFFLSVNYESVQKMKLVWSQKVISPEVGTKVAGYGTNDVSSVKSDDLYLSFLCLVGGRKKAVMISGNLFGINGPVWSNINAAYKPVKDQK